MQITWITDSAHCVLCPTILIFTPDPLSSNLNANKILKWLYYIKLSKSLWLPFHFKELLKSVSDKNFKYSTPHLVNLRTLDPLSCNLFPSLFAVGPKLYFFSAYGMFQKKIKFPHPKGKWKKDGSIFRVQWNYFGWSIFYTFKLPPEVHGLSNISSFHFEL